MNAEAEDQTNQRQDLDGTGALGATAGDALEASTGVPAVRAAGPGRLRWTAVAAAVVLAIVAGLLTWNWHASSRSDSAATGPSGTASPSAGAGPVLATQDQLVAISKSAGHPIYWAGARNLKVYELSIVGKDVYIRYLPAADTPGSTKPYLTVGTYVQTGAYAGLVKTAAKAGAKSERLKGGALVVVPPGKTTSAYFAFTGFDLLIEVYDPIPGKALTLVTSGAVQAVS